MFFKALDYPTVIIDSEFDSPRLRGSIIRALAEELENSNQRVMANLTLDDARRLLAEVRKQGISVISQHYFAHNVEAAAVPVFNFKNEVSMVIAIVGVEGTMNLEPASPTLAALRAAGRALSIRLGATMLVE